MLHQPWNCTVHKEDPIAKLPEAVRERARKRPPPSWIPPMLATLVADPFSDENWIFEPKLDGERCLTFRSDKGPRLLSRNQNLLNNAYPELVRPLAGQPTENYVADGEIVAFKGDVTSFSQLQRRMQLRDPEKARRMGVEVFYYLFDLLYLDGYDLREVPLIHRKALLEDSFASQDPVRFTSHRERDGEAYYREACRKGLEGVIAKRRDSIYVSRRSPDWLKLSVGRSRNLSSAASRIPKEVGSALEPCCSGTTRMVSYATRARSALVSIPAYSSVWARSCLRWKRSNLHSRTN
jgi:bifunctional non-homologous end joining protein LigD